MPLQQEADWSELIFGDSHDPFEPADFNRLSRVRDPVTRSKSGVQGKVADVLHGRSRHAESQNELRAFQIVVATGRTDAWQEQPFTLEYHHHGARYRYTPDALLVWGVYKEVVEIKEDADAERPDNQARFAFLRNLLAEHGYYFRLWKSSEICAEPRLANACLILRYRCVNVPAAEQERIRRIFTSTPELRMRALCETPMAVQWVLRLVLGGTLHVDWWEPLGMDARVSTSPIGRQVWPSAAATSA